ncbi:MAG: tetratricopeptide repeat protein, partial [candidate division Zixibacteria bacterium]|nr:tetratricopeptide repeat protein [candidate division Zixibacteria bacterium]
MKTQLEGLNQALKTKIEWIECLVEQRKFAQAFEEIKKVENRKKIDEFSPEGKDLCYLSAVALYRLGNYREAKSKAESAYDFLKNTSENRKVAQIQDILGRAYLDLGDLKNAENYVRDAITTYRRIGD